MDFKKLVERAELTKKEHFAKVIADNKEKLEEKHKENRRKRIDTSFEKLVKQNGPALKRLSED